MASKYSVTYNGVGYGEGRSTKSFSKLEDAATYTKDRWMGDDYQDGRAEFHNDYGVFTLRGFTLAEIGLGIFVFRSKPLSISDLVAAGRFVVVQSIPMYDNRDAIVGSSRRVHSHYVTREEAEAVANNVGLDSEGSDLDVSVEPRMPRVRSVMVGSDDLPF